MEHHHQYHHRLAAATRAVNHWLNLTEIDESDSCDSRPERLKNVLKDLRQRILERSVSWYQSCSLQTTWSETLQEELNRFRDQLISAYHDAYETAEVRDRLLRDLILATDISIATERTEAETFMANVLDHFDNGVVH